MKQKLLLLAMGLFAMGNAMADDVYFTVEKVDVMQGKSAKVTVNYDADGTKEYKGFQVEWNKVEGLEVVEATLGAAVAANNPAMTLEFNDFRESDSKTVFLGFQVALTPMPVGEGIELFSFVIKADEATELGEYLISTTKIEFASDEKATFGPKEFTVNVIPYAQRILADTDTELPTASEAPEDVLVQRTVKAGIWSTICLPFEMNEEQLKAAFGEDVKLAEFVSTEWSTEKENVLIVNFESVEELLLEANHPYVIKSANELTEFSVNDVTVQADEEEATIYVDNGLKGKNKVDYGAIHGTLKAGAVEPEYMDALLYLSNNKFYYNTSVNLNAYRAYFELDDFDSSAAANSDVSFAIDGEATAIEGVNIKQIATGDVYNVNGMYMGRAEDVMNSLPRGIYVINNKKVVVK
jgi:hypothetical protein